MPIYMKYADVKGDVTAEGHADWIEITSMQWGVGRGIASPTGGSADRESSAPSVSEVVITKAQDKASFGLLNEALQGEGVVVNLHLCKTDKGKLIPYLEVTLTNTLVSGFSMSSGGDRPTESISLNFTKIEYKSIGSDALNAEGSPFTVTYNVGTAKIE